MITKNIHFNILLFISASIAAMESNQENLQQEHQKKRKIVKKIESIYKKNIQKYEDYIQNKNILDHQAEIEGVKSQLSYIQKKIDLKHTAIHTAIQKKYEIDNYSWQYIERLLHQPNIINSIYTNKNISPITERKDVPPYLYAMLKKNLEQKNISESFVKIKYGTSFGTSSHSIYYNLNDKNLNIYAKTHASIKIPQRLLINVSLSAKEGLCIKMSSQLKDLINSTILTVIINAYIKKIPDIKEFNTIMHPIYNLSLLKHATESALSASALKNYYKEILESEESFSLAFYKKLCKIDRLHNILGWLEKYS
jgi:hypothetical protein